MLESIREDAGGQLVSHGEQEYARCGHDKSALRLAADLAWFWYHDGHFRRRPSVA